MTRKELGELLKTFRERRGLSYRKIEKLIGISTVMMKDIEAGGDSINMLWSLKGPTNLFYTFIGLFALDTIDIILLKKALSELCEKNFSLVKDEYKFIDPKGSNDIDEPIGGGN